MNDDIEILTNEVKQLRAMLSAAINTIGKLKTALDISIKFQNHYANILNMYDGGERLTFANIYDFIARLKINEEINEERKTK